MALARNDGLAAFKTFRANTYAMANELLVDGDPDGKLVDFTNVVGGYENIIAGIQALTYEKVFRGAFVSRFISDPRCGLDRNLVKKRMRGIVKGLVKMESNSNDQFDDESISVINDRIADKVLIDEMIELLVREVDDEFLTPLILAECQEMDYAEIAELLNVARGTVASRIFRGKLKARDVLEANGYCFELLQRKLENDNRNRRKYLA